MADPHIVVELGFDTDTETAIRTLWARLARAGFEGTPARSGVQPHISLLSAAQMDARRMDETLQRLAQTEPRLPVAFSHLGVFAGPDGFVLFLGVTPTARLIRLQQTIYTAAIPHARRISPFTEPDSVDFHCTLAIGLDRRGVAQAVSAVAAAGWPAKGRGERMDLMGYPPAQIVARARMA